MARDTGARVRWGQFDCGEVPGWKTDISGRIFAEWRISA